MATFIMISGSWHGSWCWDAIRPRLEEHGHFVLTPDLDGVCGSPDAARGVSLSGWVDQIGDLICAQEGPATLIGHSRAGIVISQAAERFSDRIERLIYVSAFLLPSGASIAAANARFNAVTQIESAFVLGSHGTTTIRPERARSLFYNVTDPQIADAAIARMGAEPMTPSATPLELTAERFGSVPRAYIECAFDRAIPLQLQREMQEVLPCERVVTLGADHSPFVSAPDVLTRALLSLSLPADSQHLAPARPGRPTHDGVADGRP